MLDYCKGGEVSQGWKAPGRRASVQSCDIEASDRSGTANVHDALFARFPENQRASLPKRDRVVCFIYGIVKSAALLTSQ